MPLRPSPWLRWAPAAAACVAVAAVLATVLPRWHVHSPDWRCTGRLVGTDRSGRLSVPAGSRCELVRVVQTGTVTVAPGATLILRNSSVLGDVHADRAHEVSLHGTTVTGLLEIHASTGVVLVGNSVVGTAAVSGNPGRVTVTENIVSGDLIVTGNGPRLECHTNSVKHRRVGNCYR